jgi:20S proteasome subunit alpha 5
MDPSGTYLQFDAKAIGSGSERAQQSLQEAYHKSITLKEATKSAFTILKQVRNSIRILNSVEAHCRQQLLAGHCTCVCLLMKSSHSR